MTGVSLGSEWPEMYCSLCAGQGKEHINQQCAQVTKHQHGGSKLYCALPWTAICQTEHGDICHVSDHTSQPDATRRLDEHLAAGVHVELGSGDEPPETDCTTTAQGKP